ncbi:MAG: Gfo/Idh/MocA family oxidoreductase [Saprospiraceae bacterium]|nr:Gfo/Idh/MocA family oxidoreductase [Saprospiraceae bacterium]
MNKVRWGILGLGKIARKFASDLSLVPGGELTAVASRSLEKAKAFAAEYQSEWAFGSYEELLASGKIDVIYIATPHHLHCSIAIDAMRHGLGVLCEKPAAINSKQLQRMLQVSREQNVYFMEALWSRFLPVYQELLQIQEAGTLGRVLEIEAEFCFQADRNLSGRLYNMQLGGGSILDIGIYCVYLSYLLLGKPSEIEASGQLSETGSDETCTIRMQYPNGASAHLHTSILYGTSMPARINFEKGIVLIDSRWHEAKGLTILAAGEEPSRREAPFDGKGFMGQIASSQRAYLAGKMENALWRHQHSLDVCEILDEVRRQVGVRYAEDSD